MAFLDSLVFTSVSWPLHKLPRAGNEQDIVRSDAGNFQHVLAKLFRIYSLNKMNLLKSVEFPTSFT